MVTKELIKKLQKMPQDKECLLGIDQSAGFHDDHIDVYPIEAVFTASFWGSTPLSGYTSEGLPDDPSEQYVILYVFP